MIKGSDIRASSGSNMGVSLLGLIVTLLLVPETKGYEADAVDRRELLERSRLA